MRILFISDFLIKPKQGGSMLAENHFHALCEEYGDENIIVMAFGREKDDFKADYVKLFIDDSPKAKIANIISGRPFFCTKVSLDSIIRNLQTNKCDAVYVDNSCMGYIVKTIKEKFPTTPIIVNAHGVYANSERQILARKHGLDRLKYRPIALNMIRNEHLSTLFADRYIVLNQRDNSELYRWHKKTADYILPITYEDTAKIKNCEATEEFKILFVGGYFWPNVEGVSWFSENVVPQLPENARFYIVGRGMEKLKDNPLFMSDKIEVIGAVEDVGIWYNECDLVVAPIFSGDGMKTKTTEALMYGKFFLCTEEALCGYDGLDEFHCESADDFVCRINELYKKRPPKFNESLRRIYEERYSTSSAIKVLSSAIEDTVRNQRGENHD